MGIDSERRVAIPPWPSNTPVWEGPEREPGMLGWTLLSCPNSLSSHKELHSEPKGWVITFVAELIWREEAVWGEIAFGPPSPCGRRAVCL
jgi:hypothetical protein